MRYIFLILGFCSFSWVLPQDHKPLTKKEEKFVNAMFMEEVYTKELNIPVQDTAIWPFLRTGDRIYLVKQQDQVLGYLLSTRAKGRYDYFDYLLAWTPDLAILGLTVTVYRSSYGAAICQKKWLSQFKGYSGKELILGKEINAVSGATISATSLVEDLKRCYRIMISLREEDLIR